MRIFCCLMVMFVIGGIATHTEQLFVTPEPKGACTVCRHRGTLQEKAGNNWCSFCGHGQEKGKSSKKNRKKGCKFCEHSIGGNEYSQKEKEYGTHSFNHSDYEHEKADEYDETRNESDEKDSDRDIEEITEEKRYTLDLSGVFFHGENEASSTSEYGNEYDEEKEALDIGKRDDTDRQQRRVRTSDDQDEWNEYDDDQSYDNRGLNNYNRGNRNNNEEKSRSNGSNRNGGRNSRNNRRMPGYGKSEEENLEYGDQLQQSLPMEEQTLILPGQTIDIGQLPTNQQFPTTSLPTESALSTGVEFPTALPQAQTTFNTQNQASATTTVAQQYPYGQLNGANININQGQNMLLQNEQNGMNGYGFNSYRQDGSMMSQWRNGGMNQQEYADVINETLEYLREMGIIDNDRISMVAAGMTEGECFLCRKRKFVYQIRGQGRLGVCEECLRSRNSYGGAFSSDGTKSVLEKGVMSLFGGDNEDNHGGSSTGIRSYGSGGGYGSGSGIGKGYGPGGVLGAIGNMLNGGNVFGGGAMAPGATGIGVPGVGGATGTTTGQMVLNALGQLVPMGSDPNAPYGYVKDPVTGQMRPATSPQEGLAAGAAAAAAGATPAPGTSLANTIATVANAVGTAGQMVLNVLGQLVPAGSDPNAPYGYVKDPATGQMRPATSPEEGKAAATAAAAAGATPAPGVGGTPAGAGPDTTGTADAATAAVNNAVTGVTNAATGAVAAAADAASGIVTTAGNTVNAIANAIGTIGTAVSSLKTGTTSTSGASSTTPAASSGSGTSSPTSPTSSATGTSSTPSPKPENSSKNSNTPTETKQKKEKSTSTTSSSSSSSSGTTQTTKKKKKTKA